MARFLLILLGIMVLFASITYLLGRISPRIKLVKYSPALLCLLGGAYNFYLAKTVHVGFEDLTNVILAMMFLIAFASGIVTCLILDFVLPRFRS